MPRRKLVRYVVEAELPVGYSELAWKAYLNDAVMTMRGCYHPNDGVQGVMIMRIHKHYKDHGELERRNEIKRRKCAEMVNEHGDG